MEKEKAKLAEKLDEKINHISDLLFIDEPDELVERIEDLEDDLREIYEQMEDAGCFNDD